nr:hypothetical protein [uncultured Caproiciproducens sp.]
MNQTIYGIILFTLILIILLSLNVLRQRVLAKLKNILYIQNNSALYFEALQSSHLALLLRKNSILLLELEGLLYKGSEVEIDGLIRRLDSAKLKPAERLDYLQKKLSYYIDTQNKEQSIASYQSLDRFIGKTEIVKYQKIMDDATLLIEIYINRNTELIGRLIADSEQQTDNCMKGITQYRVAKLAYYKKNDKLMNRFLALAKQNLQGTSWQNIVEQAINDKRILEVK